MSTTKICGKCKQEKPLTDFNKLQRNRSGLNTQCRKCANDRKKRWYYANPEKVKSEQQRRYYSDVEKWRAYSRENYQKRKDKVRITNKAWRAANLEKHSHLSRKSALLREYNLTVEQYDSLLKKQNHACAICGIPSVEQRRRMSVDHDHATGRIRGLICHNCNIGLGYFKDNPEILTKAANYLHEHSRIETSK